MSFKVVVIGPAKVGKTGLVRRLRNLEPTHNYLATLGVEVHPVKFTLNYPRGCVSEICLSIWDCAGDPKFTGLADGYYIGADLAIIIFKNINDRLMYTQNYKRVRNTRILCIHADKASEMSIEDLRMEIYKKLKGANTPTVKPSPESNEELEKLPLEYDDEPSEEIIKNKDIEIKELKRQLNISNNQRDCYFEGMETITKKYDALVEMLQAVVKISK